MKKLFLGLAVVSAVALTSCGGKTETKDLLQKLKKEQHQLKERENMLLIRLHLL